MKASPDNGARRTSAFFAANLGLRVVCLMANHDHGFDCPVKGSAVSHRADEDSRRCLGVAMVRAYRATAASARAVRIAPWSVSTGNWLTADVTSDLIGLDRHK